MSLLVDHEKIQQLARLKGTSESKAVRDAVDDALAAEEISAAFLELQGLGGIDNFFGKPRLEEPEELGEPDLR